MTIDEISEKIDEMEEELKASCPAGTDRGHALGECYCLLGTAYMIRDVDEGAALDMANRAYTTILYLVRPMEAP